MNSELIQNALASSKSIATNKYKYMVGEKDKSIGDQKEGRVVESAKER